MLQHTGFKKRELEFQSQSVMEAISEGLRLGAVGAGMSSFGPAVYFLVRGDREANRLVEGMEHTVYRKYICSPWSGGASLLRA